MLASMLHVVIATKNRHKLRELKALLPVAGIRWRSLVECPAVRLVKEDGRTFDANAIKKAKAAARATGLLALADDSGLEVEALGGRPGVESARFAGRHGDDQANHAKVLRLLNGMGSGKRRARYRCSLALADPSGLVALTRGTWSGRIATRPHGHRGFGYDPIFFIPRFRKTVGQLPDATKRRFSHRAMAARRMQPVLRRLAKQSVAVPDFTARRRGAAGRDPRGSARAV